MKLDDPNHSHRRLDSVPEHKVTAGANKAAEAEGGSGVEGPFTETIVRLAAYRVADPTPVETGQLASSLASLWETAGSRKAVAHREADSPSSTPVQLQAWTSLLPRVIAAITPVQQQARTSLLPRAIAAIAPQVRIFSAPFWLASALIVLLAGLFGGSVATADAHPLLFVEPLLAAAGVAFAFRSYGTPMFELEMSCPLSPPQLVFGRLAILLTYDAALGLAASCLTDRHGASVLLFVASWLVPLALISLLTLTVMLYVGVTAGLVTSLAVWSLQLILRERLGVLYLFASPTTAAFAHSSLLGLLLAVVLLGMASRKTYALAWSGGVDS